MTQFSRLPTTETLPVRLDVLQRAAIDAIRAKLWPRAAAADAMREALDVYLALMPAVPDGVDPVDVAARLAAGEPLGSIKANPMPLRWLGKKQLSRST